MPDPSVIELSQKRIDALSYLDTLLKMGLPYQWGGDDPLAGFDCSGLIHEVLQSVGLEEHGFDSTAHDLYMRFKPNLVQLEDARAGCLVFWFKSSGRAGHVEMMINGYQTIGASGGGQNVNTFADAVKYNAYVKRRPITYRGPTFKIVDPFKE